MSKAVISLFLFLAVSGLSDSAMTQTNEPKQIFVGVQQDVKLEILDWGGTGRPVVLLAGLGFDAHSFEGFAEKATAQYHVYGISRRGFGASNVPPPSEGNYSARRLADDVVRVMETLKIIKPILVGHSIAGEELSSIGIRYPEKVSGLVYLEAGYPYAYYDPGISRPDAMMDSSLVRAEIDELYSPLPTRVRNTKLKTLIERDLPRFEAELAEMQKQTGSLPDDSPAPPDTAQNRAAAAVLRGVEVHRGVICPVLAIFAVPHNFARISDAAERVRQTEQDRTIIGEQADGFQKGNPQAHVVRIANADHFIFRSNEADVLREINTFAGSLK